MKKSLTSLIAFMMLLSLILAGCGSSNEGASSEEGQSEEGGVTEITLWHMEEPPNRVKRFNEVIEAFNESNPDVQVKAQVQSWDDAYSKFPAAIQAGNGPDLLFAIPDYTTLLKQLDVVQPVDDIVEKLNEKHGFIDASLAPYQYEGETWAVPVFGMVQALWYRKDLFEAEGLEAPTTWDELLHAAEVLTKDGQHGIALPASKSMATDQVLYSFMVAAGAKDLIDADNNVTFNTAETVKAYDMYQQLLEYSPRDSNTYQWGEPQAQFNSGRAAMAVEKGQYLAPFESESGQPASELGVVPMPVADGGEAGSIYYSNGIMVLTDDAKKQEAITEFFDYLYEPENYAQFVNAEPGLFLPVTQSGFDSEDYWNDPIIAQYEEQVQVLLEASENGALFGFTDGVASNIGKVAGPNFIAQTLEQVIINGMSPEEAVEWGQQQMEEATK
ncbi:ABC transporter substrate-binding protein [Halalkalibacter krulwichiae]|uniref:sn-glycerol-3-phosphate-binding periplasmic protein UgpB n=1 Tax=Halalkalibacter krulwichiae TaxID=199441 RepID=A0A1X9MKY8_9BACI|nr:extracellular solute-binding protein [Halalkalibacter krulwichiae]ARK32411.1 sn-glycerol-3-phosphate-binding periplasmic protein UgpB precursor [Halalkalibacter krulwichiae]